MPSTLSTDSEEPARDYAKNVDYVPSTSLAFVKTGSSAASEAHVAAACEKIDIPDLFRAACGIDFTGTIPELIEALKVVIPQTFISHRSFSDRRIVLTFSNFLAITETFNSLTSRQRSISVELFGSVDDVQTVYTALKERHAQNKKASVKWYYSSNGKITSTVVELQHEKRVHDEFYPWIKQGVAQFHKDFVTSDANVLLLIGVQGAGKTSLLRDLIYTQNLATAVTYDEALMNRDEFFVDFLNSSMLDLLIIEDADVILKDRSDGNKMMNKLLNASDGLIHTKKKIVFTANLTRLEDIDPALLRPGRCFASLVFRELSVGEASAAATVAGLLDPGRSVTLAELFAGQTSVDQRPSMGFVMP